MGKVDIKIALIGVLKSIYLKCEQDSYIMGLRNYSDDVVEHGVPYGYLRKAVSSGVIKPLSSARKNMRYAWKETKQPTEADYERIAQKIINYSPTQKEKAFEALNIGIHRNEEQIQPTKETKPKTTNYVVALTLILQRWNVSEDDIPKIIEEIISI